MGTLKRVREAMAPEVRKAVVMLRVLAVMAAISWTKRLSSGMVVVVVGFNERRC